MHLRVKTTKKRIVIKKFEPAVDVVVIAMRFCVCYPLSLCALVSAWLCLRLHVYAIWVSALVIVIGLAPALVHVRLRLHYFVFVHVGVCVLVHAPAVFMPLFPCPWLCLFTRLYLFFFLCVFAHSRFFVRAHILCMCACLCAFVHVSMWLRAFVRAGDCAGMCNFPCSDMQASVFFFLELSGWGLRPCLDEGTAQQPREHRAALVQFLRIINTNTLFLAASSGPHRTVPCFFVQFFAKASGRGSLLAKTKTKKTGRWSRRAAPLRAIHSARLTCPPRWHNFILILCDLH